MSKNPENQNMEGGNDKDKLSLLKRASKYLGEKGKEILGVVGDKAKEIGGAIYESLHLEDIDGCPYSWLIDGEVFKLLDKKGNEILEADDIKNGSAGRIFHSKSGWGLITDEGIIVQNNYSNMGLYSIPDKDHEYPVVIGEDQDGKKRYISIKDGLISEDLQTQIDKWIAETSHHNIDKKSDRREKREKFQKKVKSTVKRTGNDIKENFEKFAVVYTDEQYNRVFRRKFSLKGGTKEGISYMKKGKVGIYGILKAEYENVAPCSDDYIWVMIGKKRGLVDAEGNMLIEPKFDDVYKNTYEINDKRGFINNKGEALEAKYDKIHKDGRVEVAGKYGLVNMETGEEIIEPKYDKIYDDGRVRLGNKMGLVDRETGKELIEPKYDIIFKDGRTLLGTKEGLIDIKRGIEILEPKYDDVILFKGYSVVIPVLKNNYGLVSKIDGSIIKDIEFDTIRKKYENGTLILSFVKRGMPDEVFDCSTYKEIE